MIPFAFGAALCLILPAEASAPLESFSRAECRLSRSVPLRIIVALTWELGIPLSL